MKKVNEVINEKQDDNKRKTINDEITKLQNKLSDLIDLKLDNSISKEILDKKSQEISHKISDYKLELQNIEELELTRKDKIEQVNNISNILKEYKGITKFNEDIFNNLKLGN